MKIIKMKCLSCGGDGEASCCANPKLVKASEYVVQAIADNPGKTDRAIADDMGVSHQTVMRARKALGPFGPTEKRTGKDGKSYKATKARKPEIAESARHAAAVEVIDNGKSIPQAATAYGATVQTVKQAIREEMGRRQAATAIDPSTLSASAREKLDAALRQHKKKLDAEHDSRVQAGIKEALADTIMPHYYKKLEEYDQVVKARKGVLNNEEFRLILSCLHPDALPDPVRNARAFNCFKSHELVLRGEKENPTSSFIMPRTYEELMKMKEAVRAKRKAQRNLAKNLPGIQ